jgi:hypothetical protein
MLMRNRRHARPARAYALFLIALLANPFTHFSLIAADVAVVQPSVLKIVVIEGEAGVNIIRQGTAVAPIVEVRDQNNLPIAGVPVTFTIAGPSATFAGGAQTLTVATNVAGRAAVAGITPVNAGTFQIGVQATFQGQTAVATITQTNVLTAAQAATAGASGGTSTGTTAGGTGGAASGGTAGATGAVAGGAAAAGAAAGISTGLIVGGVAAAVGGGLVVAKTAGGDSGSSSTNSGSSSTAGGGATAAPAPPPAPAPAVPPVVSSVSASPDTGLQGSTNFSFAAQGASDPAGGQLTFGYDFGDGSTGSGNPASHVYNNNGGTFTVRLTVTNPRSLTATASTIVTVKSMAGVWRGSVTDGGPFPATSQATLTLTQSGTNITGTYSDPFGPGALTGSLTGTTFNFTLNLSPCVITGTAQVNVTTMVMAGTYPQPPQASCGLSGGTFTMTKQ